MGSKVKHPDRSLSSPDRLGSPRKSGQSPWAITSRCAAFQPKPKVVENDEGHSSSVIDVRVTDRNLSDTALAIRQNSGTAFESTKLVVVLRAEW
jgi:hypothetical protein